LIKQPFANRNGRHEPLQRQSRQYEGQQRSMAGGRKAETHGPRFRNVGIEIHCIAKRIQFPCELKMRDASVRRKWDTKPSCHSLTITSSLCPDFFAFGVCVVDEPNNLVRTRRRDSMIAATTATTVSMRLSSGCTIANPGRATRTKRSALPATSARIIA